MLVIFMQKEIGATPKSMYESMWKIVNYKKPDDYVISTGKTASVKEFINISFKVIGINLAWTGKGLKEIGYDKKTKSFS